jgi:hypothetical protein
MGTLRNDEIARSNAGGFGRTALFAIGGIIAIFVILTLFIVAGHRHPAKPAASLSGCTARTLSAGSSGVCVKDVQTFVNFVEADDLSECPFTGGKTLLSNGIFDATTSRQVAVVQHWLNCYNKQEGAAAVVDPDGTVTPATWVQLCNYAYRFPSQSNSSVSPYAKTSIAAGKNAGCAALIK